MAAPSQEYPPWLTPSPAVVTNPAGALVTETTVVYVAPTYFGPSIPLGSLYSYGGSTYPPSIQLPGSPTTTVATPTTTIATPPTITTAAPTSSVSISNSLTTTPATPSLTTSLISSTITSVSVISTLTSASSPSSLTTPLISTSSSTPTSSSSLTASLISTSSSTLASSSLTTSSISTSSSTLTASSSLTTSLIPTTSSKFTSSFSRSSTTSAPTSTITPAQVSLLTKGQLVGVVVASILGLIFLFVLALFLYLFCKGRRNRQPFNTLDTVDDDYFVVPPGGHTPGEGSPRHSGEEADPFLQRRGVGLPAGAAPPMTQVPPGMIARTHTASRVPPPTNGSNSSASTVSHASGFGVLLDRPSSGYLPGVTEESHQEGGTILSPVEMQRLDRETVLPDDEEHYEEGYTGAYAYSHDPLLPPPRLVDPATLSSPGLAHPFRNNPYFPKDPSAGGEEFTTARRVEVEHFSSRSPPQLLDAPTGPSHKGSAGILGSLGLGSLANLGNRSWFKNLDSPRSRVPSPNFESELLSEKDLELGRAILGRQADSFGNRIRGDVGVGPDGSRPKSGISARSGASGATLYHDAQSSLPNTPLLAPLPPAVTSAEQPVTMSEHSWFTSPLAGPPAYDDNLLDLTSPSPSHSPGSTSQNVLPGSDVLDMPAPSAFNHFSSISSLRETATGSSLGIKSVPFPPGLETIRPVGWTDTVTAVASPSGSFAIMSGIEPQSTSSLDPLEEAPPDAELGWRSMASFSDLGARRGTFGQFVHQPEFMSEQGSLHSMRSHFNPSMRSTGSAPASRPDGSSSYGSNSSRPSRHSMALSIAHSLARTGSISSDSRKRPGHGQISPALSAFGPQLRASPGGSGQPQEQSPLNPMISSPPSVHVSPDKSTVRSMGSGSATLMDSSFGTLRGTSRTTSPSPSNASFTFSSPWAGGLDNDWTPAV